MTDEHIISLIVLAITLIALILLFIKELINLKKIKKVFTCEHCGEFRDTLSNGCRCEKCGLTFRNKNNAWEHYLMFRITSINTKNKNVVYKYKDYTKLPKIELTICIIGCTILLLGIIISIL